MLKIEGIEKGNHLIIAGSGATIKEYKGRILVYKEEHNAKIIGINYMTELCVPEYHLWTNKQRYTDLGQCISPTSTFLFGCGLPKKLIRKHHKGDYIVIDYVDEEGNDVDYREGKIYGHFRTAGVLVVMVAHIMGAGKISIVGMDGYTLYDKKTLKDGKQSHHCYGSGYTDDADWEKCLGKDRMVDESLHAIQRYGIDFDILTPTKFSDFYNPVL